MGDDSSSCSPAAGIKWKFAEPLGSCIYNTYDEIAFIMGWLSVSIWSVAMLPQIITNCKKKSAENQSFWFWILWLVGDAINFIGCILTKNIITNTALAFVYFLFTLIACAQFILFEFITKKYQKQKKYSSDTGTGVQNTGTSSTVLQIGGNSHGNTPNLRPIIDDSVSSFSNRFWSTPRFAAKYNHPHGTPSSTNEMTPKLKSSLAFLARSPRIFAISPQLTSKCKHEYEHLNASSSKSMNDESENILIVGKPSNTIIGALSSMSVTVVMLYGGLHSSVEVNDSGLETANERVLLDAKNDNGSNENMLLLIGMLFGWISTFIYIASRFPQLRMMVKSKDVSGISPLFFVLTCSGNLSQLLSMIINKEMYEDASHFVSKAPWLIGSSVCMLQDAFILCLIYLFRNREKKTTEFLLS